MARHVLIVDDSGSMRHMLAQASLGIGDVEVAEAADGLDALKHMATGRFDLMFIDVNMPMLDGLKLIRRVRTAREHRGARICVVTTEVETEEQARQLGADFFLSKPVQRRQVDAVLAEVFGPGAGPETGGGG
jgi:two-component system, chemotaxis family, chemotaxis protein CheY